DTLGHPIGDGLIYAVADRLVGEVDEDTRVSRFGGDEFMVFFNEIVDQDDLTRRMNRIFGQLDCNVEVGGHALRLQASAGAVMTEAENADVDNMIVQADLALYEAKDQGKNRWQLFEEAMDAAFRA